MTDLFLLSTDLLHLDFITSGSGSSFGVRTDYGLEGPGIESRWARVFSPFQTGPGAHPVSSKMGSGSFPGVEVAGAWG